MQRIHRSENGVDLENTNTTSTVFCTSATFVVISVGVNRISEVFEHPTKTSRAHMKLGYHNFFIFTKVFSLV